MWKGKHFWQQIVLVEVFHIVDLIEIIDIVLGHILDCAQYFLVVDKTGPELGVIVGFAIELRRLEHDLFEVLVVFDSNRRALHKEFRWNLRSDTLII